MGKEKVGTHDAKNQCTCDGGDTQKNMKACPKVAYH